MLRCDPKSGEFYFLDSPRHDLEFACKVKERRVIRQFEPQWTSHGVVFQFGLGILQRPGFVVNIPPPKSSIGIGGIKTVTLRQPMGQASWSRASNIA